MSDITAIAAVIQERPLCVSCIARKAGAPSAGALEASLDRIRHVLEIHRTIGRCRACGLSTIVLSLEVPHRSSPVASHRESSGFGRAC